MSDELIKLKTPLTENDVARLKSGDRVLLSGVVYTARDAAHKRLIESIQQGAPLPFKLKGAVIYYCGPSPAPPGRVIGAYVKGLYNGNLLDILEPGMAALFAPEIIDNTRFPIEWLEQLIKCYTGKERDDFYRQLFSKVLCTNACTL